MFLKIGISFLKLWLIERLISMTYCKPTILLNHNVLYLLKNFAILLDLFSFLEDSSCTSSPPVGVLLAGI